MINYIISFNNLMQVHQAAMDEVEAKILKYERFIDEKLKPDLQRVQEKRDAVDKELSS
jgi:hypothetical protein